MYHHIHITAEPCLDIAWWLAFLLSWDGSSCILETVWITLLCMSLYTDASGKMSWGAYWSSRWLQAKWTPAQHSENIMWKELYAIVCAVHTWGCLWSRQEVFFHCDNLAVVDMEERFYQCHRHHGPHQIAILLCCPA